MKVKRTFFNTRNERYHQGYIDINNYLFKIIYKQNGRHKEQNYILRDIKQNKSILSYIYKKINERFDVVEIETSRIAQTEYNMLKNIKAPTILDCVKIKRLPTKELSETKTSIRQDYKLQEI